MNDKMLKDRSLIPIERIERLILLIRGHKVMLDRDLAYLYGVTTKVLNQAVKRHKDRFPEDFMFQLTMEEAKIWWTEVRGGGLRSQIVTLKRGQHIKYRPYAFTEHGILMLSSVLNSERAIKVNIEIMRAFVRLRQILASSKELAKRLDELEKKYDAQFKLVFDAIRQLMAPPEPEPPKKRIGFLVEEPHVPYKSSKGSKKRRRQ
jgi:hypothetical protein